MSLSEVIFPGIISIAPALYTKLLSNCFADEGELYYDLVWAKSFSGKQPDIVLNPPPPPGVLPYMGYIGRVGFFSCFGHK